MGWLVPSELEQIHPKLGIMIVFRSQILRYYPRQVLEDCCESVYQSSRFRFKSLDEERMKDEEKVAMLEILSPKAASLTLAFWLYRTIY